MFSFQRHPDADGWRWGLGWRTRRARYGDAEPFGQYVVQRWTGEAWTTVEVVDTYAQAREVPDRFRA